MKTALLILFICICVAIVVLVTAQEGKEAGLNSISGMAGESYWGKNKGQTLQGKLLKATTICTVLFFGVAVALYFVL